MEVLTYRKSLNKIKIFKNVSDLPTFFTSLIHNRSIPVEDLVVFSSPFRGTVVEKENIEVGADGLKMFEDVLENVSSIIDTEFDLEEHKKSYKHLTNGICLPILNSIYDSSVVDDITWNSLNPEQEQRQIPTYQKHSHSTLVTKKLSSTTLLGEPLIGSLS